MRITKRKTTNRDRLVMNIQLKELLIQGLFKKSFDSKLLKGEDELLSLVQSFENYSQNNF